MEERARQGRGVVCGTGSCRVADGPPQTRNAPSQRIGAYGGVLLITSSSWGDSDVVAQFATSGFSDPGEARALGDAGLWMRGDVLDIGVGGGRTTGLLLGDAASYVGLDIAVPMLALARRRYPQANLRQGDAVRLDTVPDDSVDLVVFSFNGLDALDHDDRLAALGEMARVVRPQGAVLISSLNLDGVSFDERPLRLPGGLPGLIGARSRHHLSQLVRHPGRVSRSLSNHRRNRALCVDGEDWAMRPMRAHEFRFVVHFATVAETVREIREAGLDVLAAYDEDGVAVDPAAGTDADYVHYLCRPQLGPAPVWIREVSPAPVPPPDPGGDPYPAVVPSMSTAAPPAGPGRLEPLRRWRKLGTYAAGSVLAALCSEAALVSCYWLLGLSPQWSAVIAWLAGAVPNYWLNRSWTWQRRGRPELRREVLPYLAIVVVTLLLATGATRAVDAALADQGAALRTALDAAAFLGAYVVMFVVRYFLLDRLFRALGQR